MQGRTMILALALSVLCGCATTRSEPPAGERASAAVGLRLANEMAAAASRLDVAALAKFIPQTDAVVYVSNGNPIRGNEYLKVMGDFYSTLSKLDFKWAKSEAVPISDNAVAFTGWSDVQIMTKKGESEAEHAVFTMVFVRGDDGWKRVIAHKTVLKEPEK
jgi:ketosteroid isomerase-like protein